MNRMILLVIITIIFYTLQASAQCTATVTCSGQCSCGTGSGTSSGVIDTGYQNNWGCYWTITSIGSISLQFYRFSLETNYDYGTITSNVQLCRSSSVNGCWGPFTSTTGTLSVSLTADSSVLGSGIGASWSVTCLVPCAAGFTGTTPCTACAAGKYKTATGSAACTDCPAGSNSPTTSVALTACICYAGFTGPAGGACTACVAGKYKTTSDTVKCTDCAAGTYRTAANAASCTTTIHRSCGVSGTDTCSAAQSSQYGDSTFFPGIALDQNVGSFTHTNTESNAWWRLDFGRSVMVTKVIVYNRADCCPFRLNNFKITVGDSSSVNVNTVCASNLPAPLVSPFMIDVTCTTPLRGQYLHISISAVEPLSLAEVQVTGCSDGGVCEACPAGTTSPITSTSSAACISPACNAGYTGPDGGTCTACVAGKYKIATGSAVCTDCAAGTYSTTVGATLATACLACPTSSNSPISSSALAACTCNVGFTGPNGGTCTACIAGKYKIATGSVVCTDCAAGTYSTTAAATLATTCLACPAYSNSPSSSSSLTACTCNAGTYWYQNDWTLVRRVPAGNAWHPATDGLVGTDVYGTYSSNPVDNNIGTGWSINFESAVPGYNEFKFATGNEQVWLITTKAAIGGLLVTPNEFYSYALRDIIASSDSSTPYQARWYYRSTDPPDPWITVGDNDPANKILYAEASYSGAPQINILNSRNGANVFIRTDGGVCTACVAGKYKIAMGSAVCKDCAAGTYLTTTGATIATACLACPTSSNSPISSSALAACTCNVGFTGPDGGSCTACIAGKYKIATGSAVCTDCAVGTYSTTTGATAAAACLACPANSGASCSGCSASSCPCNSGYISNVNFIVQYSSTACVRFVALILSTPRFASVSTRNNAAVGSSPLPTYNVLGGPNVHGHVSFDRALLQYLDAGPRTFNTATNGGLTIVTVLRFSGTSIKTEDILEIPARVTLSSSSRTSIRFSLSSGGGNTVGSVIATVSPGTNWMYIVCTYSSITSTMNLLIGNVNQGTTITNSPHVPDITLTNMYIGKTGDTVPSFNGDIGGLFVVDELLGSSAIAEIYEKMLQGVDLTEKLCSGGTCAACGAGKYNINPSSTVCTPCAAGTYSETAAATSAATCVACPTSSNSPISSSALAACTCNVGFTGPDGGSCTACIAGKYKIATGSVACTDCTAGTYLTTTGATAAATCVACPTASVSPSASTAVTACVCPIGYQFQCVNDMTWPGTPRSEGSSQTWGDCSAYAVTPQYNYCGYDGACNVCCQNCKNSPSCPNVNRDGMACTTCTAGTYKDTTSSAACTNCGTGKYSATVGATSAATCVACPASSGASCSGCSALASCTCNLGFTGPNGGVCSNCVAGKYKSVTGSATCTLCEAGTYSSTNGAITCVPCPAGRYRIETGGWNLNSCTECYYAKYLPTTGSTAEAACIPCPVGTQGVLWGQSSIASCTLCVVGKYRESFESPVCSDCPGGTASTVIGSTALLNCVSCPAGQYTNGVGIVTCDLCYPGTYSATVAATSYLTCLDCPTNPDQDMWGSSTCYIPPCNAGTYQATTGSSVCTDCGSGTYSATVGATTAATCLACPVDQTSPTGSSSSSYCYYPDCNAGYTGTPGACSTCVAGTYKIDTGSALCTVCVSGKYSIAPAATSITTCVACPVNSNSPSPSSALAACTCNLGYTGLNGDVCTSCVAGTYKTTTGTVACTACAAGTFSTTAGAMVATTCLTCPANSGASCSGCDALVSCTCNLGYTGPNGGVCTACAAGTYKTTTGSVACTTCAAATFSTTAGATVATTCLACPANSGASCSGCNTLASCTCNVGYTGPDGGVCTACEVAKWKSTTGSGPCTSCPFFSGGTCAPCTDSTACKCNAGYSGPDGGSCWACASAKYKSTTGSQACTSCPANSGGGGSALTMCLCDAGFTGPNNGACTPCAAGTYKSLTGSAACTSCPAFSGAVCAVCPSTF
jgi:hypothetical protein